MTTIVSFSLTSLARLSQLRTRHQLRFRSVQPIDFTRKSKMHESVALEILGGERNFSPLYRISFLRFFLFLNIDLFLNRRPTFSFHRYYDEYSTFEFYSKKGNRVRKNYDRKCKIFHILFLLPTNIFYNNCFNFLNNPSMLRKNYKIDYLRSYHSDFYSML